jgi:hypothetical protein
METGNGGITPINIKMAIGKNQETEEITNKDIGIKVVEEIIGIMADGNNYI